MSKKMASRRDFIKLATTSTVAAGLAPSAFASDSNTEILPIPEPVPVKSANDRIRLATIGMGIIGFIDTNTALRVPGVEFVAAADAYDGRLERVNEVYGPQVFTTRDYREILARDDVDAVIISVPDHWHARMTIDALEAGKAVYCEKPMIQDVDEGLSVIEAEKRTGGVLQVGSQHGSSVVYAKAKELYESGVIGDLNMIEARTNRHSSLGAWQYSIAPDASPERIDWDRFLGNAPKRPFDPIRFFRWRNYWDYGTAMAGDLYVHQFTGIQRVISSKGPTEIMAQGGIRYWHDGRDVPDVFMGLFDYPQTDTHPAFTLMLQTNLADGSGGAGSFRFVGSDGVITIERGSALTLTRSPLRRPPENQVVQGYNSVYTFASQVQQQFVELYRKKYPTPEPASMDETMTYQAPDGYDARFDHFVSFFTGIRDGKPIYEDGEVGFRAAAPSVLSNKSYLDKKIIKWDPEAMKIVG